MEESIRARSRTPVFLPPEVEGIATNRAIMIADMAGQQSMWKHVSCEQAHETMPGPAEGHAGLWRAADRHLLLDESEYAHPNWDHAAQRAMSPPAFRNPPHQDSPGSHPAGWMLVPLVATDLFI